MLTDVFEKIRSRRLKARWKFSRRKLLLSGKESSSGFGESAVFRSVLRDRLGFGDDFKMSDNDPAVERTVETLSVVGSDVPTSTQEKEARSSGGVPSQ